MKGRIQLDIKIQSIYSCTNILHLVFYLPKSDRWLDLTLYHFCLTSDREKTLWHMYLFS